MKNKSFDKILTDILVIFLGNLCIAAAVSFFVIPHKLLVGGTSGIAVAFNAFFGFPEELVIKALTYGLFALGAVILGKGFFFKTIASALMYPVLLTLTGVLYEKVPKELFMTDTLTAIICTGALVGFGIGIVYRRNASTGGMDIIPLIINKYTGIPLHLLLFMVDGFTVLLGVIAYGLQAAIYGVISVVLCSFVIDKTILLGAKQVKQVQIISEDSEQILEEILQDLDRGCTIVESRGGYTKEKRDLLMVVVPMNQYRKLIDVVHSIDKSAFVIVSDINEIKGRGFTLQREHL